MYHQERSCARQKLDKRQTLRDAWDGTRGTPWQPVAPDLKVTAKVTADKEGAGTSIAKDCGGKNSRGRAKKILRVVG